MHFSVPVSEKSTTWGGDQDVQFYDVMLGYRLPAVFIFLYSFPVLFYISWI